MKLNSLLLSVIIFTAAARAAAQGEGAQFSAPPIPDTAVSAAGFVPEGWRLAGSAEGDLNGDGRPDLVVVAAHDEEQSEPNETTWQEPRLLVLALRDAGGELRRSAVSTGAVMCRGCGGAFGDPFADVSVERGAVVVDHYGGSRERWSFVDRFRYEGGRWVHIGETERHMDSTNPDDESERDANLVTGLVIESAKGRPKGNYRRAFYELRAGRVERAPALDGRVSAEEWPGTTVKLEGKENVTAGAAGWSGPADASARLGATYKGGDLYVRAEVTDDSFAPGDELRLVGKNGQPVKPLETKTGPAPGGYVVESRYATKSLGIDEIEARIKELSGYGASPGDLPEDRVLRVSVELVDADAGQKVQSVLSTSRGGRRHPATIRLTPNAGPPLLSNFDRARSMDVMEQ